MIGTSLSYCVADICASRVNYDDVEYIVARTKCASQQDWEDLKECYCAVYWSKFPVEALQILERLLDDRKIWQPRTEITGANSTVPYPIGITFWVSERKDIPWGGIERG